MLWDRKDLEAVETVTEKRGLALAITRCADLSCKLRIAMDLTSFDLIEAGDIEICLVAVTTRKPDIVFLDRRLVANFADFQSRLAQARVTENLPVLPILQDDATEGRSLSLGTQSEVAEIFLKTRAIIRRERPIALRGIRRSGSLILDEHRFKLFFDDRNADLNKIELCLLGPFFDVDNAVLDRQSLEKLAFDGSERKVGTRIVDFQVSRMRRRVKARLGIDPLRSVRGIGYALADV